MANRGYVTYLFKTFGKKNHEAFFIALKNKFKDFVVVSENNVTKKPVLSFEYNYKNDYAPEYFFTCKVPKIYDFLGYPVPATASAGFAEAMHYPDKTLMLSLEFEQEIKAGDIVACDGKTLKDFFKEVYDVKMPGDLTMTIVTSSFEIHMMQQSLVELDFYDSLNDDLRKKFIPLDRVYDFSFHPSIEILKKMRELYLNGVKEYMTEEETEDFCSAIMLCFAEDVFSRESYGQAERAFNSGFKRYIDFSRAEPGKVDGISRLR